MKKKSKYKCGDCKDTKVYIGLGLKPPEPCKSCTNKPKKKEENPVDEEFEQLVWEYGYYVSEDEMDGIEVYYNPSPYEWEHQDRGSLFYRQGA